MPDIDPDRVSITVRLDSSGTWIAQPYLWRNQSTGKRVRRYMRFPDAKSQEDAERMARADVLRILSDGEPISSACAAYIEHLRRAHTVPNTLRAYTQMADRVSRRLGRIAAKRLRPRDIRDFEGWLMDPQPDGAGLGIKSASMHHWFLSSLYEWLMEEGRVQENPVRQVRSPREGRSRKPHRVVVLDDAQQARVVQWAEGVLDGANAGRSCPGWHEITAFASLMALDTGLRVGEICALRVCDVQTKRYGSDHGVVHVCGTAVRSKGRIVRQDRTKDRKDRYVDLPPRGCSHVDSWMALRQRMGGITGSAPLITHDGKITNPDTISRGYSQLMRGPLDLPSDSTFHALRHTVATNLLASGEVSLVDVSQMLGHADVETTLHFYGGSLPAARDRTAGALGRVMEWQQKTYGKDSNGKG